MSDIESVALTGSLKPQNFTRPKERRRERKREGAEGEKVEGEGFSQRREEAQVGRERNTEE